MGLCMFTAKATDLTAPRAQPLLIADDFYIPVNQDSNLLRQIADRYFPAGSDVYDLAYAPVCFCDSDQTAHGVLDKGEVARRRRRSERHWPPLQNHRSDGGNHRPERLPWTEGIEGSCDRNRQAVRVMERLCQFVRRDLARRVRGLRLERMLLVDGYVLCCSIHFPPRGQDDPARPRLSGCRQYVETSQRVGVNNLPGVHERVRDPDEGAQLKETFLLLHGPVYALVFGQIPGDNSHVAAPGRKETH